MMEMEFRGITGFEQSSTKLKDMELQPPFKLFRVMAFLCMLANSQLIQNTG